MGAVPRHSRGTARLRCASLGDIRPRLCRWKNCMLDQEYYKPIGSWPGQVVSRNFCRKHRKGRDVHVPPPRRKGVLFSWQRRRLSLQRHGQLWRRQLIRRILPHRCSTSTPLALLTLLLPNNSWSRTLRHVSLAPPAFIPIPDYLLSLPDRAAAVKQ